jgi:hypothetical protein
MKGPDDSLTEYKYITNEVRTTLLILDEKVKEADFDNTLNLIVCARLPERFFAFMTDKGYEFKPDENHKWLYRRKVGLQNVAIVVLKDMPLEPMYYEWLRLAPTDSPIWKELVKVAILTDNWQLFKDLQELNFEVVKMTAEELKQAVSEMNPEQRALWRARQKGGAKLVIRDIKDSQEDLKEVLSDLKPQEVISLYKPQEVISLYKPQEVISLYDTEQVVEALSKEERKKMLELLLKEQEDEAKQTQTEPEQNSK